MPTFKAIKKKVPNEVYGIQPIVPRKAGRPKKVEKVESKPGEDVGAKLLRELDPGIECNAVELWDELRDGGGGELAVKSVFLRWCIAAPGSRVPVTLRELSVVLGVKVSLMNKWLESEWLTEKIMDHRDKLLRRSMLYIDRVNILKAMDGDTKAIDKFYDVVPKDKKGGDISNILSEDEISEAHELFEQDVRNNGDNTKKICASNVDMEISYNIMDADNAD